MPLQPINTAPRGKYILLFAPSGYVGTPLRCCVGIWNKHKERWDDHAGDCVGDGGSLPHCWMPCPDTPPPANEPEHEDGPDFEGRENKRGCDTKTIDLGPLGEYEY